MVNCADQTGCGAFKVLWPWMKECVFIGPYGVEKKIANTRDRVFKVDTTSRVYIILARAQCSVSRVVLDFNGSDLFDLVV